MNPGPLRGAPRWTSRALIALLACLTTLVLGLSQWRPSAAGAKPQDAARARVEIHALARLAPEGGIITIGARPGVRVEQIAVKEGDHVEAGALLAVLEGQAQAERQVALAEAQKKSAEFQRALGRDKLAVEREREDRLKKDRLDSQERLVDLTKRRLKAATDIYNKIGKPLQDNPAQRHELDLGFFQAEGESLKAQLDLKELQVAQDLISRRRAVEDRQLADHGPDDDVLLKQIEVAQGALAETAVLAPRGGRVLEVPAHAGEVSSGPILSLGDVSAMTAVAEVYQSEVPGIKVGDPADVVIQGKVVAGKVTRIAGLVGRNTLTSLDPRALQDRRVVAVTIRLDDAATAAEYVNMQVEVTIRPQHARSAR